MLKTVEFLCCTTAGSFAVYHFLRCASWFADFSLARILSVFGRREGAYMRRTYHTILKERFHRRLWYERMRLEWTQAEMSERLHMDERSYSDLDTGKSCCSAVTLALFLVYVCEDVGCFLEELRNAFEAGTENAA